MNRKLSAFVTYCSLLLVSLPAMAEQTTDRVPVAAKFNGNPSEAPVRFDAERLQAPTASLGLFSNHYSGSHPGAYHFAVLFNDGFSLFEGSVQLEDGSIWAVWYEDMYKTTNWLDTDLIVISRNTSLFSSYDFILTNSKHRRVDFGQSLYGSFI